MSALVWSKQTVVAAAGTVTLKSVEASPATATLIVRALKVVSTAGTWSIGWLLDATPTYHWLVSGASGNFDLLFTQSYGKYDAVDDNNEGNGKPLVLVTAGGSVATSVWITGVEQEAVL